MKKTLVILPLFDVSGKIDSIEMAYVNEATDSCSESITIEIKNKSKLEEYCKDAEVITYGIYAITTENKYLFEHLSEVTDIKNV